MMATVVGIPAKQNNIDAASPADEKLQAAKISDDVGGWEESVARTAFYLTSQGQPLFAWLHQPEQGTRSGHGVVLCPPVGYEQVHSHRSLRHLADALARAGLTVLRFDYHGTGDSLGTDDDVERHATWLANIRDAASWMCQKLGCHRLSLVGLRLGAALAMEAAAVDAVESLVLWAPVVKGRAYVREMKALGLTSALKARPETAATIEAAGFVMTQQTAEELSRLDLLQIKPRCRRVLIVARDDMLTDSRLLDHLSALGVAAEQTVQPGYAEMMAEPHYSRVPQQAIASIRDWLLVGNESEEEADQRSLTEVNLPQEAFLPSRPGAGEPSYKSKFVAGGIRERVFWVCREHGLFGIVSEPENGAPKNLPAVVLVNAGSTYRVGPGRLYVSLARQLAKQGFRCLRLDLMGLGDSVSARPDQENKPYAATAFRDLELAVQSLQAQSGAQRVVLMGLCSGAYFAFQAAVQIPDPALVESVLINPLTFYWKEGMSLEVTPAERPEFFGHFLSDLLKPRKWFKFLTGKSKLGLLGAIKLLANCWHARNRTQSSDSLNADSLDANFAGMNSAAPRFAHPQRQRLPADLDRIGNAGRRLALFFADSDPGYNILMYHAWRKVKKFRQNGKLNVEFIEGADHTFSQRAPRRALLQAISEYLGQRFGGGQE